MSISLPIDISSEIGKLEGVIIHTPGPEIENMTPENAERALYSDILNLSVARKEYAQFEGVLNKVTNTFQVLSLLQDILSNSRVKEDLLKKICDNESVCDIRESLLKLNDEDIARQLIEGVIMKKDNLTRFLSKQRYALRPLHNFFFTRDAAVAIRDKVLISRMASRVRERESLIMEAIFDYHPAFKATTMNPEKHQIFSADITIEGGDVIIAREDILLVGISARTTTQGVDYLLDKLKSSREKRHVIVQEMPGTPESFIHLDMVFTFLDVDTCMVYEPVILKPNRYQTVHMCIDNGEVVSIKEKENLLVALKELGMDMRPVYCGGTKDPWIQQREQWHSGANFFALAPGKIIGYDRNIYTIEELNRFNYEVVKALDIIEGKINIEDYEKLVISIHGSELPRGGGGTRCMTMPVKRQSLVS